MDILYFQTTMLEGSKLGGVMKSMVNYMCANKQMQMKISKQMDLTPRMLSLISGALALIPIEKHLEGGGE